MKHNTPHHWPSFSSDGTACDLSHLHPQQRTFSFERKEGGLIDLRVSIAFSFHCFTTKEDTDANRHLRYPDPSGREIRYFDAQRYAWSKILLVPMIETIEKRKIWLTNQEEFFTVETEHEGQKLFYTVFFVVGRAKKAQDDHDLWLFVSSAYEKSRAPAKMDRAIRFETILRKAYFG